jgi:hypothetical protein
MNNQYYVNDLFPTRVLYKDTLDLITPAVLQKAKEILAQYKNSPFHSSCSSTVNTFSNVLDLPEFIEIKQFLSECASVFLDIHKIDSEQLNFLDSWLNHYDVGGYQDLHMHHDSMVSGVFYLESLGNKDFVLQAPWHFQQPKIPNYIEQTLDNSHNAEFDSVPGRAIFFMSHALHRTAPATASRISLSFNIG